MGTSLGLQSLPVAASLGPDNLSKAAGVANSHGGILRLGPLQLLEQLEQADNPHTCPHGRPTMGICHSTGFGRVVRTEGRRYWQAL